jgi:hypothetical protein
VAAGKANSQDIHDVGLAPHAIIREVRPANNDGAVDRKVWGEEPALAAA